MGSVERRLTVTSNLCANSDEPGSFLFARLTLMLGSQMRQSRREGAPMTGDDEKDSAERVEPARPSKKSTEEVLKRVARPRPFAAVLVAG